MKYAVYEYGHKTIEFNTYEEACEYLDNIFESDMWFQVGSDYEIIAEEN